MICQLPERLARNDAYRLLFDYQSDDENDSIHDLSEDDVAYNNEQNNNEAEIDLPLANEEQPVDDVLEEEVVRNLSSEEDESDDEADQVENEQELVSPNGQIWTLKEPAVVGRQRQANIFHPVQGFRRGLRPESRIECFEIFFDNSIECAVQFTNLYGRRLAREKDIKWKLVTDNEMRAFIGLHFLAGALKAHHRQLEDLWSERDGHALFTSSMSCQRFKQIKQALRFDDPIRRDREDPLAPIRMIVQYVNSKLTDAYTPGRFITVDEQLVEFHGRVGFRRYIPTKPGKFGIEVYWSVDAENSFPLQCLVYIGEKTLSMQEKQTSSSIPEAIVWRVTKPFLNKGRNITGDNYFSSLHLCQRLLEKRTTYVGTMKQNKRENPPAAKRTTGRRRGDCIHYYTNDATLCSFWDKGKNPVLLISTQHKTQNNQNDAKPEIVRFYNSTKAGVDTLDKLNRSYSSKRKCRRWPYSVYFSLADNVCYAALQLWNSAEGHNDSHYEFKRDLAIELCKPIIQQRLALPNLRKSIRMSIERLGLQIAAPHIFHQQVKPTQGRCYLCPRAPDRKQRKMCFECNRFICAAHGKTRNLCNNCVV